MVKEKQKELEKKVERSIPSFHNDTKEKLIVFMRHGPRGITDETFKAIMEKRASELIERLKKEGIDGITVLFSPEEAARKTSQIIVNALSREGISYTASTEERIKPLSTFSELKEVVEKHEGNLLIITHSDVLSKLFLSEFSESQFTIWKGNIEETPRRVWLKKKEEELEKLTKKLENVKDELKKKTSGLVKSLAYVGGGLISLGISTLSLPGPAQTLIALIGIGLLGRGLFKGVKDGKRAYNLLKLRKQIERKIKLNKLEINFHK